LNDEDENESKDKDKDEDEDEDESISLDSSIPTFVNFQNLKSIPLINKIIPMDLTVDFSKSLYSESMLYDFLTLNNETDEEGDLIALSNDSLFNPIDVESIETLTQIYKYFLNSYSNMNKLIPKFVFTEENLLAQQDFPKFNFYNNDNYNVFFCLLLKCLIQMQISF
jgi:hypothetical protein